MSKKEIVARTIAAIEADLDAAREELSQLHTSPARCHELGVAIQYGEEIIEDLKSEGD